MIQDYCVLRIIGQRMGGDRAGAIEKLSIQGRQWPCCLPFREMAIDVDGNMRLCCNFYVNEKPMVSVVDKNLLDIYFSDEMVQARRELFDFGEKKEPCNSCSMYDYGQIETDNLRKKFLREILQQMNLFQMNSKYCVPMNGIELIFQRSIKGRNSVSIEE